MKSEKTIIMEFNRVIRQSERLQGCAEELQAIQTQMNNLIEELGGSWEGDAAQQYFYKCDAFSQKLKKSQHDLENISDAIRATANYYRNAELRALELLKNSTK